MSSDNGAASVTPLPPMQPGKAVPDTSFLKDPRQMPCFRDAMLTGFYLGFGLSLVTKLLLKKSWSTTYKYSTGGFLVGNIVKWEYCQYNYRNSRLETRRFIEKMVEEHGEAVDIAEKLASLEEKTKE